jgi:hypothetical protein
MEGNLLSLKVPFLPRKNILKLDCVGGGCKYTVNILKVTGM